MKKILLLTLIFFSANCSAQNKAIDSLKQLLASARDDTSRVWMLGALSGSYTWSFADTAILYAQRGLELSQRVNFKQGIALSLYQLGSALTTIGNYTNALTYLYKALLLSENLNDSAAIVDEYGALGICYRDQGDYKRAIQNLQEAIRLRKLTHAATEVGMLSSVYERDNQLDSALFYASAAYEKNPGWSGIMIVLGRIHSKLRHDAVSIDFYKKAISAAIAHNNQIDILDAYNGIAEVYLNEEKKDSAIYYAKQSLSQRWGRVYPIGMLHASQLLTKIYEPENKTDSTLKYLKLTNSLKDSLYNQQKTREANSFAFYEQLHQQELQQKIQQSTLLYKSRLKVYILVAGLVLLLVAAIGLWRRNIYKQKAVALLQKQKQEIDIQKAKAEKALDELKSTQAQLIQQEKMASLGELTAGIAHEIQNPLNFVNNFSEVNNELISELVDEVDKGNKQEAKTIANDIKQNLEKINHHGKRADTIVKGMLQHSRTSSGQKELTDINALCDEYLRLAYHGLRAKDKSFNAKFETDFDPSVGKVNIAPQEIGRVILNLINNAFYAVSEKAKLRAVSYEPCISVQTKKLNHNKIEVNVIDNGTGIPQNAVDKIFQPFFTTKPTGQGTGLGLSLTYDIIKAHGGEIKVNTKEGEGSEFIITLISNMGS